MKKLEILIPTYNRCNDLMYNLSLLDGIINQGDLTNRVSLIISNNCSTDATDEIIESYSKQSNLIIKYYKQEHNIGLEKNALFCLGKAVSDYVMYLGDDDYLSYDYLKDCIDDIDSISNLKCIIPSWIGITPEKTILQGVGRDLNLKKTSYNKGFRNCYENAHRGHQLSGLVFFREGLYDAYISHRIKNIYPFIFFVGFSCLNGVTVHNPLYPVKVTQPGQEKKDWNYGDDGLIAAIFDNYKKLDLTYCQRALLELRQIKLDPGRYLNYKKIGGNRLVLKVMKNMVFGKNTSLLGGVYISFYFARVILKGVIHKVI